MNKLFIVVTISLILSGCKGRGPGPLQTGDTDIQSSEGMVHKGAVNAERVYITVEPCKDCVKISDLFKSKKSYSGNTIEVRGFVTKFNPSIMETNWVHIQDGTEYQDIFDLTVTTDEMVQVGDTLTFKGKISLDKDFGYGYYYPVIMEDAVIVK